MASGSGTPGFLKYYKRSDDEPEHSRLVLDLENGYHLTYDCQKKLGRIVQERRGMVKTTLMNQRTLAGIGNMYSRREPGARCPRCGGSIDRIEVGGRSTYHCPDHQNDGSGSGGRRGAT